MPADSNTDELNRRITEVIQLIAQLLRAHQELMLAQVGIAKAIDLSHEDSRRIQEEVGRRLQHHGDAAVALAARIEGMTSRIEALPASLASKLADAQERSEIRHGVAEIRSRTNTPVGGVSVMQPTTVMMPGTILTTTPLPLLVTPPPAPVGKGGALQWVKGILGKAATKVLAEMLAGAVTAGVLYKLYLTLRGR
jgi:hypothetical protein